jgi:hypothetical protein
VLKGKGILMCGCTSLLVVALVSVGSLRHVL